MANGKFTLTMLASILILITIALLLLLFSMVWPPDSPWSPWWRTSKKIARLQCTLARIDKNDVIYDLGSGDGTALITAAKEFGAKGVGIEIDPFRLWYSRIAAYFSGVSQQVAFDRKNFFDTEIKDATVVFMYLIPKALNRLKPKLLKELKPGTRIVTFVYRIDLPLVASDLKHEVYVYKVPAKKT